ncbi:MAG: ABC transporter substrate-binding protein [Planctomycetaceae bacterium]
MTRRGRWIPALKDFLRRSSARMLLVCLLMVAGNRLMQADDGPPEDAPKTPTTFPTLEEMQLPPAEVFLANDPNLPRDWIVLKSGGVIACLPLNPRPNSLAIRNSEIEAKLVERRGLATDKVEQWKREYEKLQGFDITIPELEPEPEFRVLIDRIDRIIHHEDLWLRRVDSLVRDQNVPAALELLGRLEQHRPDWPGISQRVDDIIFTDANLQLAAGQQELALMLYEELSRRKPDYPNLGEKAAHAIDRQLQEALQASDYRQVRYFLNRLQKIVPGTPVYATVTGQLSQRAGAALDKAKAAQAAGELSEAVTLIEEAGRIWPDTTGLASALKSITGRYQRVRVAVTRSAGQPTAFPFPTEADDRRSQLTEIPLFEVSAFDGGAARYRTRFFDEWMPFDLGRTMRFTLRQTRQPWESQPVLLGWPITDQLTSRLDPDSPHFDERMAGYVESMTVDSPFEFTVAFRRVPPRLEALLMEPIVAAPAAESAKEQVSLTAEALPRGGFAPQPTNTLQEAIYRRVYPEPERQRQYHVAEVMESLYSDSEAALRALQQGEVDMLPTPPVWIVRRVQTDDTQKGQYFILQHAIPDTHVLQFNPATAALRSRELRRALLYSIYRLKLLDEVMLREKEGTQGRVVAGPFPSNSRANAVGVDPRPFDPYAGLALAMAARNALTASKVIDENLPRLRLVVPPDVVIQEAAAKMVDGWGRIGIAVDIVPDNDLTAYAEGRWDLIYRRVQMTEPAVQLWPFLTLEGTARINDLSPFPDWLKQEIISLDRAADYSRAEERVRQLHRHLALEAALIPLWEIDQYTIYRKNLRGFPVRPVHCYDNIDAWIREAAVPASGL